MPPPGLAAREIQKRAVGTECGCHFNSFEGAPEVTLRPGLHRHVKLVCPTALIGNTQKFHWVVHRQTARMCRDPGTVMIWRCGKLRQRSGRIVGHPEVNFEGRSESEMPFRKPLGSGTMKSASRGYHIEHQLAA